MEPLGIVLLIKIIGTLFPVALPLLILPKSKIDEISGFEPSDIIVYRLYGMAVLALLVGYFSGYLQIQQGIYPAGIVAMGFVSNTGAFLILVALGRARKAPHEAFFFGSIAVALIASYFTPEWFMTAL